MADEEIPPPKTAGEGRKTISVAEACKLAGVSRRTVYNWMSTGKVKTTRTAGGSPRIYLDTLFQDGGGR